jgi:hypothetical protein
LNGAGGAEILLLDIAGRIVYTRFLNEKSGTVRMETKLDKGIYMLQLISGGEVLKTMKVVRA